MTPIEPINLPPKIFNLKGWIQMTDAKVLKTTFDKLLAQSDFKVLSFSDHKFPLNGFTAIWLLAESHLALHTFAESGWCYIELSSCNREKALDFRDCCHQLDSDVQWESALEELCCE